ncbi:hypothetical protein, partial [Escherichia coli]
MSKNTKSKNHGIRKY